MTHHTSDSPLRTKGGQQRSSPLKPVADALLKLFGWRIEGALPTVEKFVMIVAPHTSAWDLPIGFTCAHSFELLTQWQYGFMAKDTLFRGPLGVLLRWMGGIPINRRSQTGVVEQMIQAFEHYKSLMLVITPEGTRGESAFWKSGFYRIAMGAKVPIVPASLDYKLKLGKIGTGFMPTGNVEADLDILREFYAGVVALFPDQVGQIKFRPGDVSG